MQDDKPSPLTTAYEASARVRLDVCCNDPDNGIFAHCAERLQVSTWDGEHIELPSVRRAPRFEETSGGIRLLRREWPILASKEWYGNWCWNAYWLEPAVTVRLLAAAKRSGLFHCDCGPSQLYDDWNGTDNLDEALWLSNLWGRHGIGVAA
jgi:hypothetical protein